MLVRLPPKAAHPWNRRHPAAAFKYVRDVLSDPAAPLDGPQRDAFTAAVLGQAPQLLALDADATAQVGLQAG